MLIRFGVSNFRSICEYQELSLVASNIKEHDDSLINIDGINERFLPLAGIYGPNASGKTNILGALHFFRNGILHSHSRPDPAARIQRSPFALNEESSQIPTSMDCDFIYNNVRYHYGFRINNHEVEEEWLYAYPTQRKQVWFHRNIKEEQEFYFGSFLKGKNKLISSVTRKDSLFLSSAAQNNHEQLGQIYTFFKEKFDFRLTEKDVARVDIASYFEDKDENYDILRYISEADIGISTYKISDSDDSTENELFEDLKEAITGIQEKHSVNIDFQDAKKKKIKFGHKNENGEPVYFNLFRESRGTLYLVTLLGPIFDALRNGKTLIIDEFDNSLHPAVSKKLIALFTSPKSNPNKAQLIFTSHDTSLMTVEIMRRDEVWLTEKNRKGATCLYPLTDIKTRSSDNLERGYLQGRYGAIPVLSNLDSLFG